LSPSPSDAQRVAARLLAGLTRSGVSHFLIAPGARSQALALAAEQLESAGLAKVVVRLDERALAFTALGLGLAGELAAVITTSGTAVANLHPAVLEAHHAGVPMLLLTADRPAALRGTGANQTTMQPSIFADATRATFDLSADAALKDATVDELVLEALTQALGTDPDGQPGPVQLNIQFQEPLSALEPNAAEVALRLEAAAPTPAKAPPATPVPWVERTVVLAGAGAGAAANEFAAGGGYPLFAEPSSGARFGPQLVRRYADLSDSEPAGQIERIIVFGKPTLHRRVLALLSRPQVELVVVHDRHHGHFNPSGRAATHLAAASAVRPEAQPASEAWLAAWLAAEGELPGPAGAVEQNRVELVQAVFKAAAEDPASRLLLGASELIRVADRFAPAEQVNCLANRGLAGIDGTIATALGLAIAEPEAQLRVLLGDLTLLHDASSLNLSGLGQGGSHGNPNLQLIVGNDSGGRIFENLPIAALASEQQFERLFITPQRVDLAALAQAYGWRYFKTSAQSVAVLMGERGPVLIDVSL
jgi:2-succinyl-5-enolpyruvyl-6-hydroxy-3-cyclohexene-1-carboxylate synthase